MLAHRCSDCGEHRLFQRRRPQRMIDGGITVMDVFERLSGLAQFLAPITLSTLATCAVLPQFSASES